MSELALAVFASETGTHLIRPPRGERWRAFERRFDERAYLERLAASGHRFLPRSAPDFPPLLRALRVVLTRFMPGLGARWVDDARDVAAAGQHVPDGAAKQARCLV